MVEVFSGISDVLLSAYNALIASVPPTVQSFIVFFGIALFIVIYSLIIWKFYESVSKKNLLGLNLNKYNKSKHPIITKILAGTFYFLEYILILPFLIFIWFGLFTLLLILLTENISIDLLLLLAATIIAAIRMISYHREELAHDVAKLIPLTLLATSLLNPNFFSITRIIGQIKTIPSVADKILIFLVFIILLELVLRILDFLLSLFQLQDKVVKEEESTEEEEQGEEEEKIQKELAKPAKVKRNKR